MVTSQTFEPPNPGESLSTVLVRVTNPVETFGFEFVEQELLSPMLHGIRDGLGQPTDVFQKLAQGQAKMIDHIHNGFPVPPFRGLSWR
jgi:hypothetical protein